MRAIAALKPDEMHGLCPPATQRGNAPWLARHVPALLNHIQTRPDLMLIGREHGDLDDGMMAAYLGQAWQLPFASHALQVQATSEGNWTLLRSGAHHDESMHLPSPALISISNDKSNRLRHPLMKNVALARQVKFVQTTPDAADPAPAITLAEATPPPPATRGAQVCRMLTGDVQAQATALAAYLRAPVATEAHHE